MNQEKIDIADWTLNEALRQGAQAARVELSCIDNLTVQCQDTEVNTLQQSNGCGLSIRLFVNQRYGSFSTNRLDKEELTSLIRNGITCTRLLTPDPERTLPDPSRYYQSPSLEKNRQEMIALGSFRQDNPKIDPVMLACDIARPVVGTDSRLIHLSTYLTSRSGWQYMADSQQFRGYSCSSMACAYTTANLKGAGDNRPSDSWLFFATCLDELQPLLPDLGSKALQAAVERIDAAQIPAGRYHVAIEPVSLSKMLNPLLDAMQDYNLYQHRTPLLKNNIGDRITSPLLTLTEEPQHIGAFSACLFDFEGVRTEKRALIEHGRLCQWFISTYYGQKLKLSPVLSGPNVLCIEPGEKSRQSILDSLDNTILITGFLGGNCNETTGDFSFGIEGQLYKNGERVQGISGMNLTGNILDFWNKLSAIANDTERLPEGYFPTLFFSDINLN